MSASTDAATASTGAAETSTDAAYPRVDCPHKPPSSPEELKAFIRLVRSEGEKYHKPRAEIPQSYFVDRKAPMLYCGWAWTHTYLLEYAVHHKLTHHSYHRPFNHDDLYDSPGLGLAGAYWHAAQSVSHHLFNEYGVILEQKRPISPDHDGMFVLYSNHEAIAKYEFDTGYRGLDYGRVVPLIHRAMNEGGNRSDFLWWSCYDD